MCELAAIAPHVARHTLVKLTPSAWPGIFERYPLLAAHALVRDWVAAGYPVIVRRAYADEEKGPTSIALGIATPPACGKERLAFSAPIDSIAACHEPPELNRVLEVLPPAWQSNLRKLDQTSIEWGLITRVYGSAMWQYLTGMRYLTSDSDIDLLWNVSVEKAHCVRVLSHYINQLDILNKPKIDGEIIVNQRAVNWREWSLHATQRASAMIVKEGHRAYLSTEAQWLNG